MTRRERWLGATGIRVHKIVCALVSPERRDLLDLDLASLTYDA